MSYVVVSGLPGSGKSTVARGLAARSGLPLLDKDAILEALFDSLGIGDGEWRGRLSRAADEVLYRVAADARQGVLDNWWHHDTAPARLRALPGPLVEVFCACDPDVAAARFRARRRHPGHLDELITLAGQARRTAYLRAHFPGPLRLGGPLLTVDTSGRVDLDALAARLTN